VDGVSLTVGRGERRAVIGPNGAGKSTLCRMISGEIRPTGGDVYFQNRCITGWPPERTASLGLARTFQHSRLFPQLTVLENTQLAALAAGRRGRWNAFRPLCCCRSAMAEAERALAAVGLHGRAQDKAATLSHGERRQLDIAMALAQRPDVLLLDEPIAGLAGRERAHMEALLKQLPRTVTVLFIEHDVPFAFSLADRVTVLHHGKVIAEGTPDEVRRDARVRTVYIGAPDGAPDAAPLGHGASRPRVPEKAAPSASGEPVLEVAGLHVAYGDVLVLRGVDLRVDRGEVVALLGRNGMGKTTTLHAIAGFVAPRSGRVCLNGRDVTGFSPLQLARADVALVPQGRRMFPDMTVEEQLTLGARPGRWDVERIWSLFPALRQRRHVAATSLSGGEQQMVAIARALLRNPRLLLLDEPSEGLSPLLVQTIRDVLAALRDEGETILLAEQNVPMALSLAHRVYIVERGHVVYEGTPAELRGNVDVLQRTLGV